MPLELQALLLELLDQPQALDVLGAVEAGAAADLGRRQQPARVVRAHVADRQPGLAGELVDRQGHAVQGIGVGDTSQNVTSNDVTFARHV